MDSAKLEKLKDTKWGPAKCCQTCTNFKSGRGDWGTCGLDQNTYWHKKHDRLHELPAHRYAVCDKYYPEESLGPIPELKAFLDSEVTS